MEPREVAGPMNDAHANSPAEISKRGWRDVLWQSCKAMIAQKMSLPTAGIAFYVVWAIIPTLVMIIVLAALLVGKSDVMAWLSSIRHDLPDSFNLVVTTQLDAIAEHSHRLSFLTVAGAFGFSLWSGMRGARALIAALNIVYREEERRSFWHRQGLALGLCLLGGAFVLGALALIVGLAGVDFHLSSLTGAMLFAPTRWPVLIVATLLLLSFAYRYGPCRRVAKWRWVTWGATASATIWVAGSALLSVYASHYAQFNPLLGSLGMVMVFLFWCYLTVLIVLLGAQINAELERHADAESLTAEPDTTPDQIR
ncbi:MAG: YihY/virulence factor BrkB family protein [Betaproteobacteria bacterium]